MRSVIDILTFNGLVEIGENESKPKINIEIPQPTMENVIKQIERSIDKNQFASVGVMGFDGKLAYTYTVKAGGGY